MKTETLYFKVPELPAPRNKNLKHESKLSISPIENISSGHRRSLRLSLKQVDTSQENFVHLRSFRDSVIDATLTNDSMTNLNGSTNFPNRRKSVRLALKMNTTKTNYQENNNNNINDKRQNARLDVKCTPAGKKIMAKNR